MGALGGYTEDLVRPDDVLAHGNLRGRLQDCPGCANDSEQSVAPR